MEPNQQNFRKKNMSIKLVARGAGGGGGLAGIILFGGALALVSTFAFKRKHRSNSEKNKQEDSLKKCIVKEDHAGEGLSFLVQDSLSPHLKNHDDHSPSNGTVDIQDEVSRQILLDENSETNVRNDEEMAIPEKARDNTFCDESSINKEEFPVPVADSSLALQLEEVNEKNDSLEEVEVMKRDKETMKTDCNQVGDAYNDWQVPLRIDGNNQEQVKAAHAYDQLELIGKAHDQEEECDMNGKTISVRKEILVEGAQSNQEGIDDSHKLDDECDQNGESIREKRQEPVEAAVVDQTRLDDKTHVRWEECNVDAEIIIEKGEQLIGEMIASNKIIPSEELGATAMYGDQDILCTDGTVPIRNETETCDLKKHELLLPLIDSSSVIKHEDNDLSENLLVVEETCTLNGDEASELIVQEDHCKTEDREQRKLIEANGNNKEYYKEYKENTNDKSEEADEISVGNYQRMQSGEEFQKIHINGNQEKYDSSKSLPEISSFQNNGLEAPEFSFAPLGNQFLSKIKELHKHDSAETTLHVEVINPMDKDGLAGEVFAYQIMLQNKPSVQSAENYETQICDDGGDNAAAKGEETLNTSLVDIAQPMKLGEEEDNNDDSKENVEAVEIIQREKFEVETIMQLPGKNHDYHDNFDSKEYDNDCDDGDVEDEDINNDTEEEEDDVEEVEESSETTGDSSLDSNAEAIWPDESVLEFSQKLRDMQANNQQNFKEIEEEDIYVKFNSHKLEDEDVDSLKMACSQKLSAATIALKQPTNIFNQRFWLLSLLVPFLLLIWFSISQLSSLASFEYHLE